MSRPRHSGRARPAPTVNPPPALEPFKPRKKLFAVLLALFLLWLVYLLVLYFKYTPKP